MFVNTFSKIIVLGAMLQIFAIEAQFTSSQANKPEMEQAKGAVQLSTVCSNTVDSKMNLLFAKTNGLYPEVGIFLSAIQSKGKGELHRSCANSRGDFMEYQTTEVNSGKTSAINHQMVIEKIKL